jgi:hypothetical protein
MSHFERFWGKFNLGSFFQNALFSLIPNPLYRRLPSRQDCAKSKACGWEIRDAASLESCPARTVSL